MNTPEILLKPWLACLGPAEACGVPLVWWARSASAANGRSMAVAGCAAEVRGDAADGQDAGMDAGRRRRGVGRLFQSARSAKRSALHSEPSSPLKPEVDAGTTQARPDPVHYPNHVWFIPARAIHSAKIRSIASAPRRLW